MNSDVLDYRRFPVLYVDNDPPNLLSLVYALEERFTIVTASSGEAALARLDEDRSIALVLADHRMPGMTGVELCARIRETRPEVVRMIVTAYADLQAAQDAINRGQVMRFIRKPWSEDEMVAALRTGIDVYHFNRVVKDMEQRLLRDERATAAMTAVATLAHELRNLLTALHTNAQYVGQVAATLDDDRLRNDLATVSQEMQAAVQHGITLLRRGDQHRRRDDEPAEADLSRVVPLATSYLRLQLEARASCEVLIESRLQAAIKPSELAQVLINLLTNAYQAIPPGRPQAHRIVVQVREVEGRARLTVSDTGCGIAPENLDRIFNLYFTDRPAGDGTGLGLAIVAQVMERRGGTVRVESQLGKGSIFTLELPLCPRPAG